LAEMKPKKNPNESLSKCLGLVGKRDKSTTSERRHVLGRIRVRKGRCSVEGRKRIRQAFFLLSFKMEKGGDDHQHAGVAHEEI